MKASKKIHGSAHSFFRRILPHSPDKIKYWKDMNEMHAVLDRFPGYFKALILELMELLILKSAIELVVEIAKPGDEEAQVSHFWGKAQEKLKRDLILDWLQKQLGEAALTREELNERFTKQFCQETPKILALSGIGYRPESSQDLQRCLDQFVKKKKLVFAEGKYILP